MFIFVPLSHRTATPFPTTHNETILHVQTIKWQNFTLQCSIFYTHPTSLKQLALVSSKNKTYLKDKTVVARKTITLVVNLQIDKNTIAVWNNNWNENRILINSQNTFFNFNEVIDIWRAIPQLQDIISLSNNRLYKINSTLIGNLSNMINCRFHI